MNESKLLSTYMLADTPQLLLTPPHSRTPEAMSASPSQDDYISMSTSFHPSAQFPAPNNYPADILVFSAPDRVLFYCHRRQLEFTGSTLLQHISEQPNGTFVSLREPAEVVNAMLHTIYGLSCRNYSPSVQTYSDAFSATHFYGYPLSSLVAPSSEIFNDIAAQCEALPLQIYTLAAAHNIEALAVRASSAALAVSITDIDDTSAIAMGPVYLLRLTVLQQNRKDALKRLMLVAPSEHLDTPTCGVEARRSVMRAYALAAAYLAWEVVPHADRDWIMRGLSPLLGQVSCPQCEQNLRGRIQTVLDSWELVKSTI